MKTTSLGMLAIALLWFLGTASEPYASEPMPLQASTTSTTDSRIVTGVVTKIDGQIFRVMDDQGMEVRVRVDERTTMIGNIQTGVRVEAQVSPDGRAIAIKQVRG